MDSGKSTDLSDHPEKVRGDVNPADLLTKHFGSKDKVDQLVNLYGCEFMTGRAKAAPQLKKKDPPQRDHRDAVDLELDVMDYIVDGRDVIVPEAELHDIRLWPHLHSPAQMDRMFPTAIAAPEVETADPECRDELGQLHRRWAAKKITITRG